MTPPSTRQNLPESLQKFIWAVGFECSVLPHIKVDQFEWTQHDRFWREDFKVLHDRYPGVSVRYCLPWNVVEPERDKFNWTYADERIDYITRDLGINLILDVMHFGTPLWLTQASGDPEFPEALENYASALTERYRDQINFFCPFNEPLITALFSGDFGFWPPYSRRWRGYMPVLSRIVQATARATRAIRQNAPDATIILCDSCEHHHTREEALAADVQMRNLRRFAVMDLISGKVDKTHALYQWFLSYGMSEPDLEWIKANRWLPDVIGLDYYSHTETQLESVSGAKRQRKPEKPLGLYGCAREYWQRYGIPLMVTETSIDGQQLDREIWLEQTVDDCRRLREDGIPMVGYTWWPFFDNIDWDGALLHHIGKVHQVGIYNLRKQKDGVLKRVPSLLAPLFGEIVTSGEQRVGKLAEIWMPLADTTDSAIEIIPTAAQDFKPVIRSAEATSHAHPSLKVVDKNTSHAAKQTTETHDSVLVTDSRKPASKDESPFGIVVFCHLRWGFVWQRPQQFISRFAKKHPVLFVEEPMFDLKDGEARVFMHRVMPNVVVACPHFLEQDRQNQAKVMEGIQRFARQAIKAINDAGQFDSPVLYFYNPMDAGWALGNFNERAVVYDCMDELSQFKGAPKELIANEARLLEAADVVFTGGYQMYVKKSQKNNNCHFFGCGVDVPHFGQARDEDTTVPADIDFLARPIVGWFGVIDERVDYPLLDKLAETHPEWSVAMIGPVVKVDPNLLPHRPNLFWLGGRDYRVLPNYCKAFSVCLMPFAINDATQFINPTKALEYMATGRPVVSTAIQDVIRNFGSVVTVANSHEEFIAGVEKQIRNPDQAAIERGLEMAERNSWNSIVSQMLGLLDEAIAKRKASGVTAGSAGAPRIATDQGILEITWSYPAVAGS